jgi:daunorubicin resistance ABC transporter ATP-binding subunit
MPSSEDSSPAVEVDGLTKRFGKTEALAGVSLNVPAGTVLGLLGPNGAGKTTTVRVLATLLRPDSGLVRVAGYDVRKSPDAVRRVIGLTGQYAALDEFQSGRSNLVMIGRLAGLPGRAARSRASELLESFGLAEAGGRAVKTYSGGMRRRLDLAASLVGRPRILFLDEPTTGLDPHSRLTMRDVIRSHVAEGVTLLLTTQYLEEADQLADQIAVIDHGLVIAEGTPDELKATLGASHLAVTVSAGSDPDVAADVLAALGAGAVSRGPGERQVRVPAGDQPHPATTVAEAMARVGVYLDEARIDRPSLDDVFLTLTGHQASQQAGTAESADKPARATTGAFR